MTILFDAGTPISATGVLTPAAQYVRVALDPIPGYMSHSGDIPPRYRYVGTVGWMYGDARTRGEGLVYQDSQLQAPIADYDGLYWALPAQVMGTIYRGIEIMGDISPGCQAYNSANISIPDNTETGITLDTEVFDPFGMHSTTVNPGRVTAPTPGWYALATNVGFASNAAGVRTVRLYKNGVTMLASTTANPVTGMTHQSTLSTVVYLAADDYVEVRVVQTSGGALDIVSTAPRTPALSVVRTGG